MAQSVKHLTLDFHLGHDLRVVRQRRVWSLPSPLTSNNNDVAMICANISLKPLLILGMYPEVERLYHIVVLFLMSKGNTVLFNIAAAPFYTLSVVQKGSSFTTCLLIRFFLLFFIVAILMGVRWYWIFIFICIS